MSTPICHRTRARYPEAAPCLGSACALWVPEVDRGVGPFPVEKWPSERDGSADEQDEGTIYDPEAKPTGLGWCSENLRRAPWGDPAAPNPETPK